MKKEDMLNAIDDIAEKLADLRTKICMEQEDSRPGVDLMSGQVVQLFNGEIKGPVKKREDRELTDSYPYMIGGVCYTAKGLYHEDGDNQELAVQRILEIA